MKTTGRHFLQIPGPTNVPERVLLAMSRSTVDHRGPEFAQMGLEVLEGIRRAFRTTGPVVIFPSSGTGAAEAALVNTLSPGDRVLIFETGWFSHVAWRVVAEKLGLTVDYVSGTWRRGASPDTLEQRLREDTGHDIKAVVIVHNETSTGVVSRIGDLRRAMNRTGHPALLIVDAISSLGSIDVRHDDWEIDVTVCGSQKGLMVPPGLGFNAVSEKALRASKNARTPKAYWDWQEMLKSNTAGFFPYTPATNLLYGLREALRMMDEEGLDNILQRHARHGDAARAAVKAWGLEIVPEDPAENSNTLTAVMTPENHSADRLRQVILDRFDMSLGTGLGKLAGRVFRIGHLGWFNDLMLAGTLSGVEMGLALAGVPHKAGGVLAAMESLTASAQKPEPASAAR
ncbi:MAG TPA: aminotransferase class V-fold PLP-dependent enzyme [Vicinamibacterales bacterium]|nr:aminotransferase class V-fold PLP-dependent enzyme [Vicinamibacterales bacterium]